MNSKITYTAQARLHFDIDRLIEMGISRAYVTPFTTNNELLAEPGIILSNLETLAKKAELAAKKGLEVYPFFITINHPEGNFRIPGRYRNQRNVDGSQRHGFICFRDEIRQEEMIRFVTRAAQLGFSRLAFDDDLRDAFCYCDQHISGFEGFKGKTRGQISEILNSVITRPEDEQVRRNWYEYKFEGMRRFAVRVEKAVHDINPKCRIGLCNSAKRCHDFSGRDPLEWIKLFSTADAPSFVRLCGECYDDNIMHLVQSSGWHDYFNRVYPENFERKIEITSVPAIAYRCPGTVIFETKAVMAAADTKVVHWAWTEEFEFTGLPSQVREKTTELEKHASNISSPPKSALAVYIGTQLGAYMPINVSGEYGASQDPLTAYNILSLIGLPVIAVPSINSRQPAIICSAFISRSMISGIDEYVSSGGVAVLDATAAKNYRQYGGLVKFEIEGPISLCRSEISPSGSTDSYIAHCPFDSVFSVSSRQSWKSWNIKNTDGELTGTAISIIPHERGKLVILAYDLSRTRNTLVNPSWRNRVLEILNFCNIEFPVYWDGPVAVQCLNFDNKVLLINYNTNRVQGRLVAGKKHYEITVDPLDLKWVTL